MIRITGGAFKGRLIKAPKGDQTRPTQSRLRQALFNSLQNVVEGARVLDLFSGSGALAFEALSWGAASAVLVDSSRPAQKILEENIHAFHLESQVQVLGGSVFEVLGLILEKGPYDLIFADPPYAGDWTHRLLLELPWEKILAEGGTFCLEWGVQQSKTKALPEELPFLFKVREKIYGESALTSYRRKSPHAHDSTPKDLEKTPSD